MLARAALCYGVLTTCHSVFVKLPNSHGPLCAHSVPLQNSHRCKPCYMATPTLPTPPDALPSWLPSVCSPARPTTQTSPLPNQATNQQDSNSYHLANKSTNNANVWCSSNSSSSRKISTRNHRRAHSKHAATHSIWTASRSCSSSSS
jgi:hypothetical protein